MIYQPVGPRSNSSVGLIAHHLKINKGLYLSYRDFYGFEDIIKYQMYTWNKIRIWHTVQ